MTKPKEFDDQVPPTAFRVLNEIAIIHQLASTRFESVLPHGMTLSQFTVLNHFIRLGGERNLIALANAFQVSKATMSGVVQTLLKKGFVQVRPDPKDGRGKLVSLAEAGRVAHAQSIEAIAPDLARITAEHGEQALRTLLPELMALRAFLDRSR